MLPDVRPSVPTEEQRNEARLRKLRSLTASIEKHGARHDLIRNEIAIMGGPIIDPSDYDSIQTVVELVKFLNRYPRSYGIA